MNKNNSVILLPTVKKIYTRTQIVKKKSTKLKNFKIGKFFVSTS